MKTDNVINERTPGDYEAMKNPMNRNEIVISIRNGGSMIAKVQAYEVEDHEFEENALFIVKACNNYERYKKAHDELNEAFHKQVQLYADQVKFNDNLKAINDSLLSALKDAQKCISRLIDKYNPDDIEAEWIGEIHETIINAEKN